MKGTKTDSWDFNLECFIVVPLPAGPKLRPTTDFPRMCWLQMLRLEGGEGNGKAGRGKESRSGDVQDWVPTCGRKDYGRRDRGREDHGRNNRGPFYPSSSTFFGEDGGVRLPLDP